MSETLVRDSRGLAMDNRLSGTLIVVVMDRFERRFVYKELPPSPDVFVRYVDDVGTVVPNTQVAQGTLEHLNKKHPTIQFPTSYIWLPSFVNT